MYQDFGTLCFLDQNDANFKWQSAAKFWSIEGYCILYGTNFRGVSISFIYLFIDVLKFQRVIKVIFNDRWAYKFDL